MDRYYALEYLPFKCLNYIWSIRAVWTTLTNHRICWGRLTRNKQVLAGGRCRGPVLQTRHSSLRTVSQPRLSRRLSFPALPTPSHKSGSLHRLRNIGNNDFMHVHFVGWSDTFVFLNFLMIAYIASCLAMISRKFWYIYDPYFGSNILTEIYDEELEAVRQGLQHGAVHLLNDGHRALVFVVQQPLQQQLFVLEISWRGRSISCIYVRVCIGECVCLWAMVSR